MAPLPLGVLYIGGQKELGEGGLEHWQLILCLSDKQRLSWVRARYEGHWEPTRSKAARDYCFKEDTRIEGSSFELGAYPFRRNEKTDWVSVKNHAIAGNLASIPPDVYVRCYNQLRRIAGDHAVPSRIERTCYVYWGATGTGKSRRAWEEATDLAYAKDPCTKWWCGYQGQEHVVIDEFRGQIGISHLLRWLDRYPVSVETKGSATPFLAKTIWITSNLPPHQWYLELDPASLQALLRRLVIIEF